MKNAKVRCPDLEEKSTEKRREGNDKIRASRYIEEKKEEAKRRRRTDRIMISVVVLAGIIILAVSAWFKMRESPNENPDKQDIDAMFSKGTVRTNPDEIPEYAGDDYVVLNGNLPCFTDYDMENMKGEYYSALDSLGRCGQAFCRTDRNMRPVQERGEIGTVKPSGWKQAKYPGVIDSEPAYLYNRCHLIAFALTGQNANERNLITGTRYMNVNGMLPFEILVEKYLDHSPNHVLYRVTPYFKGDELVARGVEMEAYSVEDYGEGVCFHVFVYNVQPGVSIDYQTGESWIQAGEGF